MLIALLAMYFTSAEAMAERAPSACSDYVNISKHS